VTATLVGAAALALRIASADAPLWIPLVALPAAWVLADLVSGLVHFAADRALPPDAPFVGPWLVQPFHQHHAAPADIARRGFVEANGSTCLLVAPAFGLACAAVGAGSGPAAVFAASALLGLGLALAVTNEVHKWAHAPAPPAWVRRLQRWRLVLPPEHHARHHVAPYATHFCITTGWWNPLLDRARVFARLEALGRAAAGRRERTA